MPGNDFNYKADAAGQKIMENQRVAIEKSHQLFLLGNLGLVGWVDIMLFLPGSSFFTKSLVFCPDFL